VATLLIAHAVLAADGPCVIAGRGHFQIRVGTGGLFGAFAHNHLIEAENISGCATIDSRDMTHSAIRLEIPTNNIRVIDPKESAKDRADVQKKMETDVLGVAQFPRITFESTTLEKAAGPDQLRVHGNVTIREKTQPAIILITFTQMSDGTYRAAGQYALKQSTFGIQPIQVAGGTVKVKDEVQIDFELFLR
jgi:polyisoprenoid-binding protein YceI